MYIYKYTYIGDRSAGTGVGGASKARSAQQKGR